MLNLKVLLLLRSPVSAKEPIAINMLTTNKIIDIIIRRYENAKAITYFLLLLNQSGKTLKSVSKPWKNSIHSFSYLILFLSFNASAQVKKDSLPVFIADSLTTIYIYADTGKALNRTDARGRRQGLWEKRYSDGKLRYRGHFRDDKPSGVFKYYYDGDSIQTIAKYSENGKVARTISFYSTGAIEASGKYVDEKKDSIWKYYDDMQRLTMKEQFAMGNKEGKSIIFYPDGHLYEIKNWRNGMEEGAWQQYFDNGILKLEGAYTKGKLNSHIVVYNPEGVKVIEGDYKNDLKEGKWYFYTDDGESKNTMVYKHGEYIPDSRHIMTHTQQDSIREINQQLDNELNQQDEGEDYSH